MKRHALHVVTTGRQELEQVEAIVLRLPKNCIDVLHIREKSRTASEHMLWYDKLTSALSDASIYINDRLDAAAAVCAPGVQIGYTSIPPSAAKTIVPPTTRIGCSVHSLEEAEAAILSGADYLLFGHIYETGSKAGLPGRGIQQLTKIVDASPIPVIAIGGISTDNVHEVLESGCSGVAVMSSIFLHAEPGEQALLLRNAITRCQASPKISFFS